MLGLTLRFAQRAFNQLCSGFGHGVARRLRAQALLAGACLGALVHGLAVAAHQAGEPAFRLAMALVMVTAGGLAFVLYAQQAQAERAAVGRNERRADAPTCASWLGCGLVAALQALQRLAG